MKTTITFTDVEEGCNENHLIFKGYFAYYNNNYKFDFDYIGTEVRCDVGSDIERENLANQMKKDYGYAPFDIDEARETLTMHHSYTIEQSFVGE